MKLKLTLILYFKNILMSILSRKKYNGTIYTPHIFIVKNSGDSR